MPRAAFPIAAFLVTAFVYLPSVRYGLVPYDDHLYVTQNDHVRRGLTADGVRWAFCSAGYASNWHPLTWISLMADSSLADGRRMEDAEWRQSSNGVVALMHGHNVVLHAANAALLFLLLGLLCRNGIDPRWLLALTLLWSLHPLRTEAVCWVSERKEVLCVLFMLLSAIAYVGERVWLSLTCAVLALLAKPVAVTLPVLLLAYDLVFVRRLRLGRLAPFFVASLVAGLMTLSAQTEALDCGSGFGLGVRLNAIVGSPAVYAWQTVWPANLSAAYRPCGRLDVCAVGGGVVLLALMAAAMFRWLAQRRLQDGRRSLTLADVSVFAVAWVYVGLVPMLGIVKVGWQEHSDRYTYWIGCGACAAVALALAVRGHQWWESFARWIETVDQKPFDRAKARRACLVALFLLTAALSAASLRRMSAWQTPVAFMRDTIPKCWNVDFVDAAVRSVPLYGAEFACEVEQWARQCAAENRSDDANLVLARFLVQKGVSGEALAILGDLRRKKHRPDEVQELVDRLMARRDR